MPGWFRADITPKMMCNKCNRLDPWSTGSARVWGLGSNGT